MAPGANHLIGAALQHTSNISAGSATNSQIKCSPAPSGKLWKLEISGGAGTEGKPPPTGLPGAKN